jgi:hypothetical protein
MSTTSNTNFTKIQDTVYDSKLMEGLSNLGIFPSSFKVIVATVDVSSLAIGAAVIQALVDDHTGNQVVFAAGQQVILVRGGASTAITTEANLDLFQVGVAATATGAVVEVLSNAATGELLGATTGTGLALTTDANGGVIGTTNIYGVISTTVSVANLTAGVIKVVLVVV